MSTFSERVTRALAATPGLTQRGLAAACGVKPPSVNGWVKGHSESLMAAHLYPAAAYLGVRPRWLATGLGPMRGPESVATPEVAEPPLSYGWPFARLSRADFECLPDDIKKAIDDYAALRFRDWTSHQNGAAQGAA